MEKTANRPAPGHHQIALPGGTPCCIRCAGPASRLGSLLLFLPLLLVIHAPLPLHLVIHAPLPLLLVLHAPLLLAFHAPLLSALHAPWPLDQGWLEAQRARALPMALLDVRTRPARLNATLGLIFITWERELPYFKVPRTWLETTLIPNLIAEIYNKEKQLD